MLGVHVAGGAFGIEGTARSSRRSPAIHSSGVIRGGGAPVAKQTPRMDNDLTFTCYLDEWLLLQRTRIEPITWRS